MDEFKIVYQDRILKITRMLSLEKGCKYKIEITSGSFSRSWEEYFSNDEEAIRSANQKFSNLGERQEV
jgi:predicted DNA-binding antitoxin AbrB/MazE fold protein